MRIMRVRMVVAHSGHDAVACSKSRWLSGQIDFAFLGVLEQSKGLFEEIGSAVKLAVNASQCSV